ncbi:hypothetical protein KCP78_03745 [Salmonella enterica subsp. enterica]|nr:hypothetical protein KCP78_03745 [Salmonella enterica subsp. enterica]
MQEGNDGSPPRRRENPLWKVRFLRLRIFRTLKRAAFVGMALTARVRGLAAFNKDNPSRCGGA